MTKRTYVSLNEDLLAPWKSGFNVIDLYHFHPVVCYLEYYCRSCGCVSVEICVRGYQLLDEINDVLAPGPVGESVTE